MPGTYEPIATYTTPSSTTGFEFLSIPQTYTDLVLVVKGTTVTGYASINYFFNGDGRSTGKYSTITFQATNGSSTISSGIVANGNNGNVIGWAYVVQPGYVGTGILDIYNYSNSTTYKSCIGKNAAPDNSTTQWVETSSTTYQSTSPITRLEIFAGNSGTLAAGFTATIYGIKAA